MRTVLVGIVAADMALAPLTASAAADPSWEQWQTVAGVFDFGGPRSDGSLLVAGSPNLYLADPAGNLAPFASGPGGYHPAPGAEAYVAVSPGLHVGAAGCDFIQDETFVLRLQPPFGIDRLAATGENAGSFATVSGVTSLNGIAFDSTGAFDHRLLASGGSGGKTVIAAVDCRGTVQPITSSAPALEGGLAVAPLGFGVFGGDLIAPDEVGGSIYAIAPDGKLATILKPSLPTGGDIGVESLGFVPTGLLRGGMVYYADRKTQGNPHPGTDSVLRLPSSDLVAAGVQEGDLLVATEGGAALIAVHCADSCREIPVVSAPTTAHGEGHIVFTINKIAPSPTPSAKASPKPVAQPASSSPNVGILALAIAAGVVVSAIRFFLRRRRR
ncbi:MAG: hypothetical protein AUJ02_10990 [Chloroflexi bacterium 13_1_40CM_3_65_12]|nr:MAG: hypothetical protein AUH40_08335 [Chloroflexi bacterium 13_1_40CM_65_17]OLC67416.1 MAG: hypothetical protein AUH69_04350 [Actinobacteria bacterium 13_1_40CM_4_65_12]OLD23426.1 MAG: hypothetical protein AUJ02_10990 [Chloroflexi bacterium 13_1_40CM_3_65_12]OLD46239.1 MAG: hypothetical protein AUI48_09175 [Chloroflexi bacterium 13_1_40CM_2_68_14]